jgi:hypothetical protein
MADLTLEQLLGNPEGLSGAAGMLQAASPKERRGLASRFFEKAMPFVAPPGVMEAIEGKDPTMKELLMLGVLGPLGGKARPGLKLLQGGKAGQRRFGDATEFQQRRDMIRNLGEDRIPVANDPLDPSRVPLTKGKSFDEIIASERSKRPDQGVERLELDPEDALRGDLFKPGTILRDRNTGKLSTVLAKGAKQEREAAGLLARRIGRGQVGEGDLGKMLGVPTHKALRDATDLLNKKHVSNGEYIELIRDLLGRHNIRGPKG